MATKTIASFFEKEPYQWGVRSDPHLWKEMEERFAQTPIPETAHKLARLVVAAFESLAERSINEAINRHDVPGMMKLISDDCVFENTTPDPDSTRYSGVEL
jgi:hypothetical protein